jgi:steroid 5-alpha reductase family enzyme
MPEADSHRRRAFTWCAAAYVLALFAAIVTARSFPGSSPLFTAAAADLVATVVVFAFSVAFNNSSFYDPYWSVAPMALALYWTVPSWQATDRWRAGIAAALTVLWAVRLTRNWARGWRGLGHEDWRYVDLRRSQGAGYWPVSFLGVHLMPTVLVFLGCIPLYAALTTPGRPYGALDLAATLVTGGAIWIEAAADTELRRFVRARDRADAIMTTGLWAWSRHPNYFGEVLFWWGIGLFGVSAAPGRPWILAGPLAITALFLFISIPMMERHLVRSRPAYLDVQRRVSRLIPWLPR